MSGISGILRPNGLFVSCSYGNHGVAADTIPEEEGEDCIYLSSGMETKNSLNESIVYFVENITKKQKDWLFQNYLKLDKKQRELVVNKLIFNEDIY